MNIVSKKYNLRKLYRLWKKGSGGTLTKPERLAIKDAAFDKEKATYDTLTASITDSPEFAAFDSFVRTHVFKSETPASPPTLTPTQKDFEISSVKKYVDEIETLNNLIEKLKSDNQEYLIQNNELQLKLSETPQQAETEAMTNLMVENGNMIKELEHSQQREAILKSQIESLRTDNENLGVRVSELENKDYDAIASSDDANYKIEEWKRNPTGLPIDTILNALQQEVVEQGNRVREINFDYSKLAEIHDEVDIVRLESLLKASAVLVDSYFDAWEDYINGLKSKGFDNWHYEGMVQDLTQNMHNAEMIWEDIINVKLTGHKRHG